MNEIELYSKLQNPVSDIRELGKMVARSGMFGCEREEAGCTIVMMSWMDRMTLTQWARTYDLVEGKARKKALAALSEFRASGGKHRWLSSGDAPTAKEDERYAEIELIDKEGNKNVYRYSMADARAEGLVKDKSRWVKRPGNMLRARCISNGLGMLAPEIFAGDDSDSDFDPAPSAPLNLAGTVTTQAPAAGVVAETPAGKATPATGPVIDVEEVKVEAQMGLAPETKPFVQPPPPAATKFAAGPAYTTPAGTLPPETVEQLAQVLSSAFLPAALWLAKEGWLPKPASEPTSEPEAAAYLEANLAALSPARANRILKQKDSFMRAVKG